MTSKSVSKRRLDDEQQKQREIRKGEINRALQEVMTTSNDGSRRDFFTLLDLAVRLKMINDNWSYEATRETVNELVSSGMLVELENKKGYIPAGNRDR